MNCRFCNYVFEPQLKPECLANLQQFSFVRDWEHMHTQCPRCKKIWHTPACILRNTLLASGALPLKG